MTLKRLQRETILMTPNFFVNENKKHFELRKTRRITEFSAWCRSFFLSFSNANSTYLYERRSWFMRNIVLLGVSLIFSYDMQVLSVDSVLCYYRARGSLYKAFVLEGKHQTITKLKTSRLIVFEFVYWRRIQIRPGSE